MDVLKNKERYLELIRSITVKDANIEGFIRWLEKSDFFTAPATTRYHGSYEGGLCAHSLQVYDNLVALVETFATIPEPHYDIAEDGSPIKESMRIVNRPMYTDDAIKMVALLHDISKTNFYTSYTRNVKDETTGGKWQARQEYKTKEPADRFIFGSQEQNSVVIAQTFFPLQLEESSAILNHLGGMGFDSNPTNIPLIFTKYSLALLLHTADLIASYHNEKVL